MGCEPSENVYISDHAHYMARHAAKFYGLTPSTPSADTLNFKPIFNAPLKKNCKGTWVPGGGVLARLGHSLAHVKIWGHSTT